ncbi:ankyrin repeat-containing domain protein [Rhexocercosporidium sp. MPI-PUGE-AT-0058]|nr:ankyrin repeat-containing domain protein [Rhexocercosporidium sp. MPI-PUGE-AT-0058]
MVLLNRASNILAQVSEYKYEALTFAIQGHDPERVFQPLIERGARLHYQDIDCRSPFITACASGKIFLIHHFFRHESRLDATDIYGITPLQTAAFAGHERAFDVLLDYGADIAPICTSPSEYIWQLSTLHCAAI